MAQNLILDGITYNGVDSLSMTNENGKKISYIEDPNPGTGVVVAKIGEKEYFTVEKALAEAVSGDTVQLIANTTEVSILVPYGVTVDLNGYTMTVEKYVIGFVGSHVIDNSGSNNGLLVAAIDSVKLDVNNAQLPVWNGEAYFFVTVVFALSLDTSYTGEGYNIKTIPAPELKAVPFLKDGAADNNLQIGVRFVWDKENGSTGQDIWFSETSIINVYTSNKGTQTGYGRMFALAYNPPSGATNLKANTIMKSGTGVEVLKSKALELN